MSKIRPQMVRLVLDNVERTLNAAGIEDAEHAGVTFSRGLSDRPIEKLTRGIQEYRQAFVRCEGISAADAPIGELGMRLLVGVHFFRKIGNQSDDEALTWDTLVATAQAVGEELTTASEVNGAAGFFGLASGVNRVVDLDPMVSMELQTTNDADEEPAEVDEVQGIYQFSVECRVNLRGEANASS